MEATTTKTHGARNRIKLLDCRLDTLTLQETVDEVDRLIQTGEPVQALLVNAHVLLQIRDDAKLSRIAAGCSLVSADGQSLVWAARLLAKPLPERVAGPDLFAALLGLGAKRGYSVYFLGGRPGVAAEAARRAVAAHAGLRIAGVHHGYFDKQDSDAIRELVRLARPEMLFVGMDSPWREYWIADNVEELGVPFAMGIGGALDVSAGVIDRAPMWMQRAGLEWAHRLCQEPRRMWRRYLVGNLRFTALVLSELVERVRRTHNS